MDVKTEQERKRLDEIFAEVEAYEKEQFIADAVSFQSQNERDEVNYRKSIERIKQECPASIAGNVRQMIKDGAFKTKWELILSDAYIKLFDGKVSAFDSKNKDYGAVRAELEVYRNFVNSVQKRLDNAEKTAREQDNHHYYKIFAESVKKLLDNL